MLLGDSVLVWFLLSCFSEAYGFYWLHLGCYGEQAYDMAETSTDTELTTTRCGHHCKDYRYYGVKNGDTCICINGMSEDAASHNADYGQCIEKCKGNLFLRCGGVSHTTIYMKSDTYIGCYRDEIIDHWIVSSESPEMTFTHCRNNCGKSHYKYAAVQNEKCICGSQLSTGNKVSEDQCDTPCPGHDKVQCGGSDAVSLYYADGYQGCFVHGTSSLVSESSVVSFQRNFVQRCMWECSKEQKQFSVVSGNDCSCGEALDGLSDRLPPEQCNNLCSGDTTTSCGGTEAVDIYQTPKFYFGCVDFDSIGDWEKIQSNEAMKPKTCRQICGDNLYKLSGLTQVNGTTKCFCGNNFHPEAHVHENTTCDVTCFQGSQETCGGDDSVDVFSAFQVYCSCYVTGDPHVMTFDKERFSFQGKNTYLISESKEEKSDEYCHFKLTQKNKAAPNQNVSYLNYTDVHVKGDCITLQNGNTILFNDIVVPSIPFSMNGISVNSSNGIFRIEHKMCGLIVRWDGKAKFEFHVEEKIYANTMIGICGNCNGNRLDEFGRADGAYVENEQNRDNFIEENFKV